MNRRDILAGAAAVVASAGALPARAADTTVRIATLPLDVSAACVYADTLGYFRDAGIVAEISATGAGSTLTPVIGNAADIGFASIVGVAIAYKHNVPVTIIAPADVVVASAPTNRLLLPKGSSIKTARDLEGKTIAVNGLKTISQLIVQNFIDANGGDSTQTKFVEMAFPAMLAALSANRVDCALLGEPFIAAGRETAVAWADPFATLAPRNLVGVWFASTHWAQSNRPLVAAFNHAMTRTAQWANSHHAQSAPMLQKFTKIDSATLNAMVRATYPTRFEVSEMQPLIDLVAHYALIPATFPVHEMIFTA